MRSPSPKARQGAAQRLGSHPGKEVTTALLRTVLDDSDRSVRQAAATSLGKIGLQSEIEVLREALNSNERRIVAADALGLIGDSRAADWLLAALGGSYGKGCPVAIAEALIHLGDPRAVDAFVALLDHYSHEWRKVAASALDHLGWHPATRAQEARRLVALQLWSEAAQLGTDAVEPLVRCCKEGEVMEDAATALKAIGADAIEPVVALLPSPWPSVRETAIDILQKVGDSRAIGPLVKQASMTSQTTAQALAALGQLLVRTASTLSEEALQIVAAMPDSTEEAREGMEDGAFYYVSLSCCSVKALAASELSLRNKGEGNFWCHL